MNLRDVVSALFVIFSDGLAPRLVTLALFRLSPEIGFEKVNLALRIALPHQVGEADILFVAGAVDESVSSPALQRKHIPLVLRHLLRDARPLVDVGPVPSQTRAGDHVVFPGRVVPACLGDRVHPMGLIGPTIADMVDSYARPGRCLIGCPPLRVPRLGARCRQRQEPHQTEWVQFLTRHFLDNAVDGYLIGVLRLGCGPDFAVCLPDAPLQEQGDGREDLPAAQHTEPPAGKLGRHGRSLSRGTANGVSAVGPALRLQRAQGGQTGTRFLAKNSRHCFEPPRGHSRE